MNLKDITRAAVLGVYTSKGIKAVDAKVKELILQCEQKVASVADRGIIKGELAEVALECHICEFLAVATNLVCIKGFCIKSFSGRTTEIDLLLASPARVYLFECKSFVGKKTVTDKCFLKGISEKDVYAQSVAHLEVLNQLILPYRVNATKPGVTPYKMVLFELSSDVCTDLRGEKWKQNVPLIHLGNVDSWLLKELSTPQKINWDFARLKPELERLNMTSSQNFDEHLKRLRGY